LRANHARQYSTTAALPSMRRPSGRRRRVFEDRVVGQYLGERIRVVPIERLVEAIDRRARRSG